MLATELVADGLATINEAVKFIGVSRSDLYNRMERGELAYCKIGKRRMIPRKALVDFAAAAVVNHVRKEDERNLAAPQGSAAG